MAHPLVRAVAQFFRAWWRVDRIRVAPDAGELLRLGPGAVVLVHDLSGIVRWRTVASGPGVIRLLYGLDTADGDCILDVLIAADGVPRRATLHQGAKSLPLETWQICVLEPAPREAQKHPAGST